MNDLAQFLATAAMFGMLLAFAVNLAFGLGLYRDAERRHRRRRPVRFVSSAFWLLATLIGSFLVVALYWLVHDSTLVAREPDAS